MRDLLWFYCDACDQFFALPDPTDHWTMRLRHGDMPVCPDGECDEDVVVFLGRTGSEMEIGKLLGGSGAVEAAR